MNERLVIVDKVMSEAEAEIVKSILASHEIEAGVMGNPGLQQGYGMMAVFQVVVKASLEERARQVIEAYYAGDLE